MGIAPASVIALNDAYNDLVNGATDLVGAAASIAPAAAAEVFCQAGGLASLLAGPFGPLQSPGSGNRLLSDMGAIAQAACQIPPPLPDPPAPPFDGGQCPGISYRVEGVYTAGGATEFEFVRTTVGPIRGTRIDDIGSRWNIILLSGESIESIIASPSKFSGATVPTARIDAAVRTDGLPDDCGSLPPPTRPPGGRPPIPDLPESPIVPDDDPAGGGGFIFKPTVGPIQINIDGRVSIPVVVNVGGPSLSVPVTIPVNVNLPDFSPTVVVGGGGGSAPPGQPSDPTDPPRPLPPVCCEPPSFTGPVVAPGEDEEAEGEPPPPGQKLLGLMVTAVVDEATSTASTIFQTSFPLSLRVPRLANVYFTVTAATEAGVELSAETSDRPLKLLNQFFEAPSDMTVTGWRVVPEAGVSLFVSPVYTATNQPEQPEE